MTPGELNSLQSVVALGLSLSDDISGLKTLGGLIRKSIVAQSPEWVGDLERFVQSSSLGAQQTLETMIARYLSHLEQRFANLHSGRIVEELPPKNEDALTISASEGLAAVIQERKRQIRDLGYGSEHDAEHQHQELVRAALCYLVAARDRQVSGETAPPEDWPWDRKWWKPKPREGGIVSLTDARRMLVKAAALICAEIDRLDTVIGTSKE